MARPKDESGEARATKARLGLKERQAKARMKEAAALSLANAKAQEREAMNVFKALPLKAKIRLVAPMIRPTLPADRPRRPLARFAGLASDTIRQALERGKNEKTQENTGEKESCM